jgi:tetratricopeptide (TPR) repeat protein
MAAKAEGNFSRASSLFKDVIEKDAQDKSGLVDQARQELNGLNRAKAEQAKPLYDEAVRLIRNEQWVEARKKLTQAVKIDPNFAEAQGRLEEVKAECRKRAESLYREARVQSNIQQYSQAEKLLRQALQYVPDPDDPINEKINRELKNIGKE